MTFNRQEMEYYARKYGLMLIIVLTVLFSLFPLVVRVFDGAPITPGAQSYLYLRRADLLSAGSVYDPLRQQPFAPNPYVVLLAIMGLFGVPWMLPMLLAVLFVILLYYLLECMVHDRAVIILILITFIISPTMHDLATTHNPEIFAMIALVAAALMFRKHMLLGCVLVVLSLITSPILGIFGTLLFLAYFTMNKQYHEIIGIVLAVIVAFAWFLFWTNGLPQLSLTNSVFFEFGSTNGMSIFFIILASLGVVMNFRKMPVLAAGTIILVACTIFVDNILPLTVALLSIFAGFGVFTLLTKKWELELLREALLILICCIGLFIVITTIRERIAESPTPAFAHTMITLRNQHHEGGVLTLPEYAPLIEYFSGRTATFSTTVSPEVHSRDPLVVYPFLTQTNTAYVLLTPEMRRTVFTRSDEGMLFLMQNGGRFVQIEESENELWYFIRLR